MVERAGSPSGSSWCRFGPLRRSSSPRSSRPCASVRYPITTSRHLEAPEKSVRLVFRAGREVELVCVKAAGFRSKHECPQPIDDERMGHRVADRALVLDAQMEALELELVDVDLAVAEVADEQPVRDATESRRRDGH